MKRIILFALLGLLMLQCVFAQGKQKVSVLYVGGSGEMETTGVSEVDSVELAKSVKARTASFSKFLKAHFRRVKVVDAKDYVPAMSADYDVTVFDGRPTPLRPTVIERDAQGRVVKYERAAYLPDDFDRPVLCIADASEEIGRSIGTKCDWFCLCLDADAHHWVKDHPIFQGPFKVDIRTEMKPTPPNAFEYAEMYGYELPAETEMWTVQTKSYTTDRSYRIGMVSRPEGFLDSPEAEVISSGTCAKSIDAVAIGRHGNFFHWGFSASPDYLTEAGKAALANAIVYISKFAGQHVIARKLDETIATRKQADAQKFLASREAWQDYNQMNRQYYQAVDSIRKVALTKQERGEELDGTEKMYLAMDFRQPEEPTYAEYLKQRFPTLYHVFGDDAAEYARYYEKNRAWFRPDEEGYNLDIDEDVRTLGIANNDKRLLDTCIVMLEKGKEPELARRVLERYTLCRFATPAEWRKWYDTYQDKLFFTESGGWLWLVNTFDRSVPGNDYSVLKSEQMQETASQPAPEGETDEKNPVALSMEVNTQADGSRELVVRMKVHPGYHTYAQVADEDPFLPTVLSFELPEGCKLEGDLVTPVFTRLGETSTTVYTGDCLFRQKISGTGKGEVKCMVEYQCCDDSICFPPARKTLTVQLR